MQDIIIGAVIAAVPAALLGLIASIFGPCILGILVDAFKIRPRRWISSAAAALFAVGVMVSFNYMIQSMSSQPIDINVPNAIAEAVSFFLSSAIFGWFGAFTLLNKPKDAPQK